MFIYVLNHKKNADSGWESDYRLFLTEEAARAAMCMDLDNTLKAYGIIDTGMAFDDAFWGSSSSRKFIWNGKAIETWRVETQALDVKVAVKVHGGMVQSVIANAAVDVDVYDLDVSSYPEEGEEDEADEKRRLFEELASRPDWRGVW